jgi:4-amino-4-deoxy-L-arabinose transferase-like glycosyltransferase
MTGVTGLVGARLFGTTCGRLAMIICATGPMTFVYGKAATMDQLVAAAISAATGLLLLRGCGIGGPSAVPAAWAMMALAVLAKGPIGFVIPLGVVALTAALLHRLEVPRVVSVLGLLVFVVLASPWFIAIYADQGFHFVEVFLLNHNLQRFTSTIHNHPGPVYYYLPVLLLGLFPWSILAFVALPALAAVDRDTRARLIAWFAVPLLLFSAAGSKLPGYILPCVPPLAIVLSLAARKLEDGASRIAPRVAGLSGLVLAAVGAALVFRGIRTGEPWARSALAPALWLLATMFLASRAFEREPRREALRVLSIGAPGLLLLLNLVAPRVVEGLESGRLLFAPTNGREVVAVGAWRTAWMAGYFYNDGRVREAESVEAAMSLAGSGQGLFLLGPRELGRVKDSHEFEVLELARGPRSNVLVRLSRVSKP